MSSFRFSAKPIFTEILCLAFVGNPCRTIGADLPPTHPLENLAQFKTACGFDVERNALALRSLYTHSLMTKSFQDERTLPFCNVHPATEPFLPAQMNFPWRILEGHLHYSLGHESPPRENPSLPKRFVEEEPQLSKQNPYGETMRSLLYPPIVSVHSIKRRKALREIGPALEKFTRWLLRTQKASLMISPLGSSLAGYARRESDIEFTIALLDGSDEQIIDEQSDRILKKGTELLEARGFVVEPMLQAITHVFDFSDAVNERLWISECSSGPGQLSFIAGQWFRLFLPSVYGNPALVETARRQFMSFLRNNDFDKEIWPVLQSEQSEALRLDNPQLIQDKPHLRAWLRKSGMMQGEALNKSELRARNKRIAFPVFEQMEEIYFGELRLLRKSA